ncbi:MAG: hypothetical protein CMO01_24235 [Thalassobius sp.]|nr:hypothetical protein [Thalassovita sp.]
METQKLQHNGINEELLRVKHDILNKIISATILMGIVAAFFSLLRDQVIFYNLSFPPMLILAMNIAFIIVLVVIYIFKAKINLNIKASLLAIIFLIIANRAIINYGWISNGFIFFGLCSFVFVITFQYKTSIYLNLLISLSIPVIAFLFFNNYITINSHQYEIIQNKIHWVAEYISYFLFSFAIIVGVGGYQKELLKNFQSISQRNKKLQQVIDELNKQIQVKELYQQEVINSENKFKSLFKASRDGILLLDENARVLEANPALLEMSGYSFKDLSKINIFEIVSLEFRNNAQELFKKLIQGNLFPDAEIEIIRKDGQHVIVELSSNLIISDQQLRVLSSLRNITTRKQYENDKFNAVIQAEEKERERFSKDLHDDLGPVFSTVKLYLESLLKMEHDQSKKIILENLTEIVDGSVKQVREISHNLSPYLLRDKGLVEAMKHHIDKMNNSSRFKTVFDETSAENTRLPENIETLVYRVFLELFNNTFKHSGASEISISLNRYKNNLLFTYIDNGIGFDFHAINNSSKGIGLKNIINRTKAFKGSVHFEYQNHLMKTIINIPL